MQTTALAGASTAPAAGRKATALARLTSLIRPRGKHRATPVEDESVQLAELLVHAEPGDFRYCPEEMRIQYHAIHADRSRTCWTCNTTTEEGTQP